MRVTVDVKGDKELVKTLQKMSEKKKARVKNEVYASGIDIQREAKRNLKEQRTWDLGNLANSIFVDRTSDGMTAEVGPTAPYGPYQEFGTRPHFPPPDALEGWARRHGFDSVWPICLAIAERGLPARPYLYPAWDAEMPRFWKRVREIAK